MSAPQVLVTGAGGGLGSNVLRGALKRGWKVRALVRNAAKAALPAQAEVVEGDAMNADTLTRALDGCSTLFHMVNVNLDQSWVKTTGALLDAALQACKNTGARLVYPANVWIFGRGTPGRLVGEDATAAPCSEKGASRWRNEQAIRASGVRHVKVRLPEFYGPHVQTLTGPPLRSILLGKRAVWFGRASLPVEFVFMPDAAQVLLDVGIHPDVDGECFHLPGTAHTTPRAFFREAIRQEQQGSFVALPSALVRAAGLVNPLARSFADIIHLWEDPILLDGSKLRRLLPDYKSTPLELGIMQTLNWIWENKDKAMYF